MPGKSRARARPGGKDTNARVLYMHKKDCQRLVTCVHFSTRRARACVCFYCTVLCSCVRDVLVHGAWYERGPDAIWPFPQTLYTYHNAATAAYTITRQLEGGGGGCYTSSVAPNPHSANRRRCSASFYIIRNRVGHCKCRERRSRRRRRRCASVCPSCSGQH